MLHKVISQLSASNERKMAPFRFRFAQVCIGFFSSIIATFFAIILICTSQHFSLPKTLLTILSGMVVFYLVANLSNPFGQIGILNEWLAAAIPYISVFILLLFISRWGEYFSTSFR